jgi:glc operon protein GlcG
VKPLRGAPEVELLGNGDEVLDQPEVQAFDRRSLPIERELVLDLAPWRSETAGRAVQHARAEEVTKVETNFEKATRPTVSSPVARRIIDAAVVQATDSSVPVTVVVVDESGVLKEMVRMDGAPLVSVQTAMNKAYAATAIGMPPDEFYAAIESDGAAVAEFATRPGLALIAGGLPVIVDGIVAGGVGVAGAMTGAQDRHIAEAAISSGGG